MNMRTRVMILLVLAVFAAASCATFPPAGVAAAAAEREGATRVACVGDSITYGASIMDREQDSYPAQLNRMLGDAWEVRNFGVNGATLLKKGDRPYWKTGAFGDAKAWKPDVVIIKLGTNDTKPQNWAHKASFADDCRDLIDEFAALPSAPRIMLCLPVPVFQSRWGITEETLVKEVIPAIRQIATEKKLRAIDLHKALEGKGDLFPDRIHPNAAGAKAMAEVIYQMVTGEAHNGQPFPGAKSDWHGYAKYDFKVGGHSACVVTPKAVAPGKPWIWRARFFGHEPQADLALLARGFHVAYMEVGGLFGSREAVARWNAFYAYLTQRHGFHPKPALEGMSRGGLIIFNWAAAFPSKVACIYADAPVCDFKSWPGGKGSGSGSAGDWQACLNAYGLTEEQALKYKRNPIDNLKPLAKAGIPLFHVCGGADKVVPVAENTAILEERYKRMGGDITTIIKDGVGHHPHSLKDPKPIVDFILSHVPFEPRCIARRGGLANARIAFERGKKARVAFLGGSITNMTGWRQMTCDVLTKRFPDTEFDFINAGIPSTDTALGPFRLQDTVFSHGPVDMLFVEFAVNDDCNYRTSTESIRGMEGIIRQARKTNPELDIIMMHFVDPHKMEEYNAGRIPTEIAAQERVAATYKVASINLAREVTLRINAGEFAWSDFKDLHPSPFGHKLYTASISHLFDLCWSAPLNGNAKKKAHGLAGPIDPRNYERARFVALEKAQLKKGWKLDPSWKAASGGTRPGFVNVPMLTAGAPGAELKLDFTGTAVGLLVVAGPDVGVIEYSIDGGPARRLDQFTEWSGGLNLPWAYILDADLNEGAHKLSVRTTDAKNEKSKGHACRIVQFLVN